MNILQFFELIASVWPYGCIQIWRSTCICRLTHGLWGNYVSIRRGIHGNVVVTLQASFCLRTGIDVKPWELSKIVFHGRSYQWFEFLFWVGGWDLMLASGRGHLQIAKTHWKSQNNVWDENKTKNPRWPPAARPHLKMNYNYKENLKLIDMSKNCFKMTVRGSQWCPASLERSAWRGVTWNPVQVRVGVTSFVPPNMCAWHDFETRCTHNNHKQNNSPDQLHWQNAWQSPQGWNDECGGSDFAHNKSSPTSKSPPNVASRGSIDSNVYFLLFLCVPFHLEMHAQRSSQKKSKQSKMIVKQLRPGFDYYPHGPIPKRFKSIHRVWKGFW